MFFALNAGDSGAPQADQCRPWPAPANQNERWPPLMGPLSLRSRSSLIPPVKATKRQPKGSLAPLLAPMIQWRRRPSTSLALRPVSEMSPLKDVQLLYEIAISIQVADML
mgnify:CR=1 FL=1